MYCPIISYSGCFLRTVMFLIKMMFMVWWQLDSNSNIDNDNFRQLCISIYILGYSYIWCTSILCRCSDGDVCSVDAQMINDIQCTCEGSLHTSQAVKIYLRFLMPPSVYSWLASVTGWGCACQNCVSWGSCAICIYHVATSLLFTFIFVVVGLIGNITLRNTSIGIAEGVVTQFCLQEWLMCSKNLTSILCSSIILHIWSWKIKMVL